MKERILWFLLGAGACLCLGAVANEKRESVAGSYQMVCVFNPMHDGSTSCVAMDTRNGKIAWTHRVSEGNAVAEKE